MFVVWENILIEFSVCLSFKKDAKEVFFLSLFTDWQDQANYHKIAIMTHFALVFLLAKRDAFGDLST